MGRPAANSPVPQRSVRANYLATAVVVATCVVISWLSELLKLNSANIVMIFLAGVALVAALYGHGPAIAAAVLSVLVFDFFFVHPTFSLAPNDAQYFLTFTVMLGIGLLISELTARLQSRLRESQLQERRSAQLYRMTRQLSTISGTELLLQTAGQQLREIFSGEVALYIRGSDGELQLRVGDDTSIAHQEINSEAARWVVENDQQAGAGTPRFPSANALFLPMLGSQQTVGVLGIRPTDFARLQDPEQREMLETCAGLIALSIERDRSLLEASQAQMQVETEQLRNSLLSSVSHDLRTPLATIAVNAASLLDDTTEQNWPAKRYMLQTVVDESHRLARQVDNLLEMARLNSGSLVLNRDGEVFEELVGVALTQLRADLQRHAVQVQIPIDFPLLYVAGDLMEKVLINLLENAIRYTPPDSQIEITATHSGDQATIRVADNGPGLPAGCEAKVFEHFFQGPRVVADGQRGIGLGLAICKSIVQAHGGQICAANRPGGGAEFVITLPCSEEKPDLVFDDSAAAVQ